MKTAKATYLALLITCLLLASISGLAQTSTTGNMEGTVTDTNGEVVPGARVVISGASLLRPQAAIANDEGHYRIGNFPPGKYSVKVEASEGYAAFEENDVEVQLSKTTTVDITLNPKGEEATQDVPREENRKPAQKEEPASTTKSKHSVAELTIRERQAGDVMILDLEGKITDAGGATALRNAVRGLLGEGKRKILLNFKDVGEVGESGIGAMVAGHTAAQAEESSLKFVNLSESLKEVLVVVRLLTVFDTYAHEAEALNSFK